MDENRQQHHSSFGTAFLLGLVVGAGLALLFATKRGRRILKALSEGGLEKLDNLEDVKKYFRSTVDEFATDDIDEEAGASEYVDEKIRMAEMPKAHSTRIHVANEEPEKKPARNASQSDAGGEVKENGVAKKSHPVKRLFRGVPKRS